LWLTKQHIHTVFVAMKSLAWIVVGDDDGYGDDVDDGFAVHALYKVVRETLQIKNLPFELCT